MSSARAREAAFWLTSLVAWWWIASRGWVDWPGKLVTMIVAKAAPAISGRAMVARTAGRAIRVPRASNRGPVGSERSACGRRLRRARARRASAGRWALPIWAGSRGGPVRPWAMSAGLCVRSRSKYAAVALGSEPAVDDESACSCWSWSKYGSTVCSDARSLSSGFGVAGGTRFPREKGPISSSEANIVLASCSRCVSFGSPLR